MVLAGGIEDVAALVHEEGVGATAEGVDLDELDVVGESGYAVGGVDDAVGVGPL